MSKVIEGSKDDKNEEKNGKLKHKTALCPFPSPYPLPVQAASIFQSGLQLLLSLLFLHSAYFRTPSISVLLASAPLACTSW